MSRIQQLQVTKAASSYHHHPPRCSIYSTSKPSNETITIIIIFPYCQEMQQHTNTAFQSVNMEVSNSSYCRCFILVNLHGHSWWVTLNINIILVYLQETFKTFSSVSFIVLFFWYLSFPNMIPCMNLDPAFQASAIERLVSKSHAAIPNKTRRLLILINWKLIPGLIRLFADS